jgi:hypothetical protein
MPVLQVTVHRREGAAKVVKFSPPAASGGGHSIFRRRHLPPATSAAPGVMSTRRAADRG